MVWWLSNHIIFDGYYQNKRLVKNVFYNLNSSYISSSKTTDLISKHLTANYHLRKMWSQSNGLTDCPFKKTRLIVHVFL